MTHLLLIQYRFSIFSRNSEAFVLEFVKYIQHVHFITCSFKQAVLYYSSLIKRLVTILFLQSLEVNKERRLVNPLYTGNCYDNKNNLNRILQIVVKIHPMISLYNTISSKPVLTFSSNSEADASELPENSEEMFSR